MSFGVGCTGPCPRIARLFDTSAATLGMPTIGLLANRHHERDTMLFGRVAVALADVTTDKSASANGSAPMLPRCKWETSCTDATSCAAASSAPGLLSLVMRTCGEAMK
eukprot:scaffold280998_cov35-Tisochrysis_lutea.AAC.1